MIEYFRGLPYPIAVAALFVVVVLRAGASYAIGRGVVAGASRTKVSRVLDGERFGRVRILVDRWGAPVVALSFLTIGFQTVANVAAGVTRMPLRRYLPALAIGGLLWAFLYATVGVLGVAGFTRLYEVSPVAAIVVVIGLAGTLSAFVAIRTRTRTAAEEDVHDEQRPDQRDDQRDDQRAGGYADRLAAHDRLP